MKKFLHRCLLYIIRKLEYFSQIGFDLKNIRQARHLRRVGIHYSRYTLFNKKWLVDSNIQTVIDIGASVGEFTAIFAELFPAARIYAFEPLKDDVDRLRIVAERYPGRVQVFNTALGAQNGSREFNRSSWAPASSFRAMTDLHKENYPHSAGSERLKVETKRLDDVLGDKDLDGNILVKIDVQGYEDEVIKGGPEVIKRARILVIECSLQNTYDGEPMFDGIYNLLRPLGFEYQGSLKQSIRRGDQSYLQADCIFIKNK